MNKKKSLFLLLAIPALVLGACSDGGQSSSNITSNPSSEPSSSSTEESSSSAIESSSSEEPSSSASREASSSSQASSSSSAPKFEPYQAKVNVELGPSINSEREDPYNLEFTYDDNYFLKDAKAYDKDLSLLSFGSAIATESKEATVAFFNAGQFNDITPYGYESAPTADSVGYTLSHKNINGSELIAINVRGLSYGMEWQNNFLIGETGDHVGFITRANDIYQSIQSYITAKGIKNTLKLWISGYSRGGAVSNALASVILRAENPIVAQSDMFVYTFEAPACLDTSNCIAYENVHNIINVNDLIPRVPPAKYGLGKCGVDYPIYDEDVSNIVKELDEDLVIPEFAQVESVDADSNTVTLHNDTELVDFITDAIFNYKASEGQEEYTANTREEYYNNFQDDLGYMIGLIFALSSETRSEMLADLSGTNVLIIVSSDEDMSDFLKVYLDKDSISYTEDELLSACNLFRNALFTVFLRVVILYMSESYRPSLVRLIDMHYPETAYALLVNAHKKADI